MLKCEELQSPLVYERIEKAMGNRGENYFATGNRKQTKPSQHVRSKLVATSTMPPRVKQFVNFATATSPSAQPLGKRGQRVR